MPKINILNAMIALDKAKRGKRTTKGCFGGKKRFLGNYTTLKVIPKSKRTPENCNAQGVAKSNV